ARASGLRLVRSLGLGQRRLGILEAKLELVGIELLGTAAEAVPLESLDDRPQTLDFGIRRGLRRLERVELAGLFEDESAQRVNVFGQVRFHEHGNTESTDHGPVKRRSSAPSSGARHGPGASRGPREARPVAPLSGASR